MNRFAAWVPAVCMMLVSVISYVDRNTLAILAPTILQEAGLSKEQYGYIISAFSIAYMVGNPVWGKLIDRVGVRAGMLASVTFWTLASAAHALAGGFWSFGVARAALGFGEGATFPGGLRTAMQTLRVEQRARGVAIAYSGGSLGAIVTPIIVTPIFVWWGWRAAFLFTGFIGVAWLVLWWFVSLRTDLRDAPYQASSSASVAVENATGRLSFLDPRIWSFMAVYSLGALPIAFVLYASSIYLNQELGVSQTSLGKLLWIPPLGWEIGYFFWGWVTDRTCRESENPIAVQARLLTLLAVASLPLAAVPRFESLSLVMTGLFLAMFITAGFVIVPIAYATRVYSSSYSGLIAGLGAGSWGAAVAVVMPFFGRMFDQERYQVAFTLAAILPIVGYLIWIAVNLGGETAAKPGADPIAKQSE